MSTGIICIKVSKQTKSRKRFLVSCSIPEATSMSVTYLPKDEWEKWVKSFQTKLIFYISNNIKRICGYLNDNIFSFFKKKQYSYVKL